MTHTPTQYKFIKQNSKPVPIECVEDEHEESRDFQPSFWWNNRRYFLDDLPDVTTTRGLDIQNILNTSMRSKQIISLISFLTAPAFQ